MAVVTQPRSEPQLIHRYVEVQAQLRPEQPAFEFLDDVLTYAQLDARANQLAHQLVASGVKPGDRVGIYMPKAIDTPVTLFGIMKAGAAYVPLDPSAPVERIGNLINDCEIKCLVSSPGQRRALKKLSRVASCLTCVIGLDDEAAAGLSGWTLLDWHQVGAQPDTSPDCTIAENDLAYVIYTSGSTGSPKGIMHTHRSGLCFSRWAVNEYGFTHQDRLSNHAPLHFDLSIMDFFSSVIAGATVVIVPEDYTKLPASYSQLIEARAVSVLYTVPFALIQLLLRGALEQRDLSKLRYAIFGGEPFPTAHLRSLMKALPHVRFDNIYGPAEVNGVSHYTVPELNSDSSNVPIGPIAQHASALIIDGNDQKVSPGETGELLVHTESMMTGYWNRPGLTERSLFRPTDSGGRVFYRTGDLVRVDEQGVMSFVGRKDRQVKVRGYRVELDEIELALTSLDPVEEGAAYVLEMTDGSREIHAEITLKETLDDTSLLTRSLKQSLPWYAVPSKVSVRNEFPRGATGKIDRRKLKTMAQIGQDEAAIDVPATVPTKGSEK